MGRPGTPGPADGSSSSGERKATLSGAMVLMGILSFVLGVIAVTVPYWGHFRPGGHHAPQTSSPYGNTGFFGPWNLCNNIAAGYGKDCNPRIANYNVEVYLKLGGVCGLVAVGAIGLFTVFSGLHCAMQINNKRICLKYRVNIFLAFLCAIIAEIATIVAVLISIPQFTIRKQQFVTELGACYYIEICLIFLNLLLTVISYLSYKKARKSNFPIQRNPYEISATNYGEDQFHGGGDSGRGITVTSNSGVQYFHQPGQPGHHLGLSHLPAFPGPPSQPPQPGYLGQIAQPQVAGHGQGHGQGYSQGYPGYPGQPVAAVAPQQRLPPREERVDLNPGGRHKTERLGGAARGGMMGSMESLTSSQGSEISFGSTMSSNASINNPLRSSLKKPKNKETVSMNSTASSKKSVRLALGEEQTAV